MLPQNARPWSVHFWSGCRRVARNLPQNRKTLTQKKDKEAPPLYADIDVGTSDDEGGNPKVAAVPHPSEDEEDEGDAYHEEDYVDDDEEEVEFEG
jgi:hypothetical protein